MGEEGQLRTEKKVNVGLQFAKSGSLLASEEGYFDDRSDLQIAEILQDQNSPGQESLYRSLQTNFPNGTVSAVSSNSHSGTDNKHDEIDTACRVNESFESQLTLDEAVARSVDELENGTALENISAAPSAKNTASTSMSATTSAGQDEIDPDNMTYEELQSLGESIGTESKGLTDDVIAFLPSHSYKTGLFSRKQKQNCVICCMVYKNKETIISLPCKHDYHSKCITQWLKINKACPVCNEEVFG